MKNSSNQERKRRIFICIEFFHFIRDWYSICCFKIFPNSALSLFLSDMKACFRLNISCSFFSFLSVSLSWNCSIAGSSLYNGMMSCSISHIVESLFDGFSFKEFAFERRKPAKNPDNMAQQNDNTKFTN